MAPDASRRLLYLDLLRGYLMFAIIVDHFQRWPGFLEIFSGEGRQWVSAAEGFFFISGLMVGYVRGRHLATKGFAFVARKLGIRSLQIYALSVLLTLFFLAQAVARKGEVGLDISPPELILTWNTVWSAAKFDVMYGWTDFLGYYAVFMLASIPALLVLRKGWWWLVALVSFYLYLQRDDSFYLAWQLLFMAGVIIGYHFNAIRARLAALPAKVRGIGSSVIVALAVALYVLSWHANGDGSELFHGWITNGIVNPLHLQAASDSLLLFNQEHWNSWFTRMTLDPGRLAVFSIVISALFIIFSRYERFIEKWFGWLLLRFGRASLLTFAAQGVIIYWLDYALPPPEGRLFLNFLSVCVVELAVLAAVCGLQYGWRRVTNLSSK